MTWIIDTCVLLDVRLNDPEFGRPAAACLAHLLPQSLAITPITYIELAPAFRGEPALLDAFLDRVGVAHQAFPGPVEGLTPAWSQDDTAAAFSAWHHLTQARRARGGTLPRRPIADLLIATVAQRFAGIVTRNSAHFRAFDQQKPLRIVDPTCPSDWPSLTA